MRRTGYAVEYKGEILLLSFRSDPPRAKLALLCNLLEQVGEQIQTWTEAERCGFRCIRVAVTVERLP